MNAVCKLMTAFSTVCILLCGLMGCQTSNQHINQLANTRSNHITKGVTLTSFRTNSSIIQQPQQSGAAQASNSSATKPKVEPPQKNVQAQTNKQDTDEKSLDAASPTPKTLYTAPSSASALAIASAALGSVQNMTAGGREVTENISISTSFRRALQPSLSIGDRGTIGKRGLQRGAPLTGANNLSIFTPRSNSLANRCQELITTGFFADITGCRNSFKH